MTQKKQEVARLSYMTRPNYKDLLKLTLICMYMDSPVPEGNLIQSMEEVGSAPMVRTEPKQEEEKTERGGGSARRPTETVVNAKSSREGFSDTCERDDQSATSEARVESVDRVGRP